MEDTYLFRGQLVSNIQESGDLTVFMDCYSKKEASAKTYNFKKYAQKVDTAVAEKAISTSDINDYIDLVNDVKTKLLR